MGICGHEDQFSDRPGAAARRAQPGMVYVLLSEETVPGFNSPSASNSQDPPATDKAGASTDEAVLSARQTLLHQIAVKQAADGTWGRPLDERVPLGGPVEDIAILARLA